MEETGKTAVARAVMRNREYLYNLRPYHGAFIAFTLHYPQEIRDVTEIEEVAATERVKSATTTWRWPRLSSVT